MMYPEGNFDSEGGGGAQMFPAVGGNVQSDLSPFNEEMRFRATPDFDYYASIGTQVMRMQQQQQMLAQQLAQRESEGMQLGGGNLTGGFDQNWLAGRLAAGSANGAKI